MIRRFLQLTVTILTFIAFTNAASACCMGFYQPQLPDELR